MGNCTTEERLSGCFDGVLGEIDQTTIVNAKNLITSPLNNIGCIIFKPKSHEDGESPETPKGMGFLISQNLVLSSSHNFVRRGVKYIVNLLEALSFSTLQPEKNGSEVRIRSIQEVRLNPTFIQLFKQKEKLKKKYSAENDQVLKQQYKQKISRLEEQMIKHDFALLKLEQPIMRQQYFKLCPSLPQKTAKLMRIYKAGNPQVPLDPVKMITKQAITVLKGWASQMRSKFLNQKLKSKPIQLINDLRDMGDYFRNYAQFKEALIYYQKALDMAKGQRGMESVEYTKILSKIGQIHLWDKQYQQSQKFFSKELQIYKKIFKNQSLEKANALTNISIAQATLNKKEVSKKNYLLAVEKYKRIQIKQIKCPYALYSIGRMYDFQEQTAKAFDYYLKAQVMYLNIGKNSIGLAMTYNNMATVYHNKQIITQAIEYYGKALQIHEKIGKEQIYWANTLYNIGNIHYNQRKHEQAFKYYSKALVIHEKIGKEDSIEWANTLYNIGNIHYDQSQHEQAFKYYSKALAIHEKIGKEDSIEWANALQNIGLVYKKQKQNKQALQHFNQSLMIHEKIGKEKLICARILVYMGATYDNLVKGKQRFDCYFKAVTITEKFGEQGTKEMNKWFEKNQIEWVDIIRIIGVVYHNKKQLSEALKYYEKAFAIHTKTGKRSISLVYTLNNIGDVYMEQGLKEEGEQFHKKSKEMFQRLPK